MSDTPESIAKRLTKARREMLVRCARPEGGHFAYYYAPVKGLLDLGLVEARTRQWSTTYHATELGQQVRAILERKLNHEQ